ncbi:MAG TPA: phosphoribosylaminoimidazolesuccinocarboxamide synthase [Candidatus Saccharimonadales bacterium]|nr:phosphoribosylaminoimidazolesuccinocarboxamide synthase [Candidatus Saccharimonadales bacterium]
MANLIRSGKVKDVYEIDENELEFVFSDRISVFDKIIPSRIPYKGETLARTSTYWFDLLKQKGISTDFIKLTSPNTMRVKRVSVISDYSKLNNNTRNYLIPLELIVRYFVYGSLWDRVKQGLVKPADLGFPHGHEVKQAEPLPEPFFEVTTKLEETDRNLTKEEALKISGLTLKEYDEMRELCLKIDEEINSKVKQRGMIHVDGKKEFAFDKERKLMVIDTFGTADEDRFWDTKEFEQGRYIERSKEFVRQFYRNSGYHEQLYKARKEGAPEPDIPPLPEDMVKKASETYIKLFEDMTGQNFR